MPLLKAWGLGVVGLTVDVYRTYGLVRKVHFVGLVSPAKDKLGLTIAFILIAYDLGFARSRPLLVHQVHDFTRP